MKVSSDVFPRKYRQISINYATQKTGHLNASPTCLCKHSIPDAGKCHVNHSDTRNEGKMEIRITKGKNDTDGSMFHLTIIGYFDNIGEFFSLPCTVTHVQEGKGKGKGKKQKTKKSGAGPLRQACQSDLVGALLNNSMCKRRRKACKNTRLMRQAKMRYLQMKKKVSS